MSPVKLPKTSSYLERSAAKSKDLFESIVNEAGKV
jgi:hypothetical protein